MFLGKLVATQMVKKFPGFMEPKGSLLCSQDPNFGLHTASVESSPHSHTICCQDPFQYNPSGFT